LAFTVTVNASNNTVNTEPQIFCGTLYKIKSLNWYIAATFERLIQFYAVIHLLLS